jgi:hypothetical protein
MGRASTARSQETASRRCRLEGHLKKGWNKFKLETRYPHLRSEGLTPRRAEKRLKKRLGLGKDKKWP